MGEKKLFWLLAEKLLKAKMTKVFTHVIYSFYSRANKTCSIINYSLCSIGSKSDKCFYTEGPKNRTFNNFLKNGNRAPKFWYVLSILMCSKSKYFFVNKYQNIFVKWQKMYFYVLPFLQCFYPCVLSFVTCIYTNDALAQNVEKKTLVSLLSHKVGPLWVQKNEFNYLIN